MPFPFLRRERDVRKGIKVSSSILKFHFPVPLPISSLQKGEKGRREIRGQNMPPNFSSTLEDGQRRAQAVGHSPHPAVPSSPEPPPSCRYGLLPVPASASPPLLPGRPLRSCNAPSPAAFSSSSRGTEAAARQGAGAGSYCKAPSNNWERQRRVRAHLPEIRLLGRNLDFIPPHRCLLD